MKKVLQALLLFHSPGSWDEDRKREWLNLTGSDEATTKVLCDFARKELENQESIETTIRKRVHDPKLIASQLAILKVGCDKDDKIEKVIKIMLANAFTVAFDININQHLNN